MSPLNIFQNLVGIWTTSFSKLDSRPTHGLPKFFVRLCSCQLRFARRGRIVMLCSQPVLFFLAAPVSHVGPSQSLFQIWNTTWTHTSPMDLFLFHKFDCSNSWLSIVEFSSFAYGGFCPEADRQGSLGGCSQNDCLGYSFFWGICLWVDKTKE